MSGALLAAALAVLLWPARAAGHRIRQVATGSEVVVPRTAALSAPVTAAIVGAAGGLLLGTPLVAGLAASLAFVGGRSWAARARARRTDDRLRSLTEGLGALGAELRSGRSFEAATGAAVAACADDECGTALARALRTPGTAAPPGDELGTALERVSAGVLLSARTGCSLAAVAAAVEDDLRAGLRLRQELRTATAGPRASAMLLAGLPLVGLAMGSGVGADPWRVLTTTGPGQVLLVVGVALELLGLLWSERLVRRAVR
ncbi:MAG TPA: pilus assembly protein TadB [Blastococcus sp.]|nr:pilus assembly protein TadB [Blastococcus sp.]